MLFIFVRKAPYALGNPPRSGWTQASNALAVPAMTLLRRTNVAAQSRFRFGPFIPQDAAPETVGV
jgi:hypothetical protein